MSAQNQGCLGFLGSLTRLFGSPQQDAVQLPYRLRDDFLTRAELSFYHVLRQAAGDRFVICPKVSLKEIFFVSGKEDKQSFRNRIDRKHVDFVLCDPHNMRPVIGLELDDSSHQRAERKERDQFVEQVCRAAGLPLVRVPVRSAYVVDEVSKLLNPVAPAPLTAATTATASEVPMCPKCRVPMVLRTSKRGDHAGQSFYGCPNYPSCRETVQI